MQYTDNTIAIVKKYQKCYYQAYRNRHGVWAIGYNHTNGVKPTDVLDDETEAEILLREDADTIANAVEKLLDTGRFTFVPNQNEVDALVSFGLDMGIRVLNALVTGRTRKMMGQSILSHYYIDGEPSKDAKNRRHDESALFTSKDLTIELDEVDPIIVDNAAGSDVLVEAPVEEKSEEHVVDTVDIADVVEDVEVSEEIPKDLTNDTPVEPEEDIKEEPGESVDDEEVSEEDTEEIKEDSNEDSKEESEDEADLPDVDDMMEELENTNDNTKVEEEDDGKPEEAGDTTEDVEASDDMA